MHEVISALADGSSLSSRFDLSDASFFESLLKMARWKIGSAKTRFHDFSKKFAANSQALSPKDRTKLFVDYIATLDKAVNHLLPRGEFADNQRGHNIEAAIQILLSNYYNPYRLGSILHDFFYPPDVTEEGEKRKVNMSTRDMDTKEGRKLESGAYYSLAEFKAAFDKPGPEKDDAKKLLTNHGRRTTRLAPHMLKTFLTLFVTPEKTTLSPSAEIFFQLLADTSELSRDLSHTLDRIEIEFDSALKSTLDEDLELLRLVPLIIEQDFDLVNRSQKQLKQKLPGKEITLKEEIMNEFLSWLTTLTVLMRNTKNYPNADKINQLKAAMSEFAEEKDPEKIPSLREKIRTLKNDLRTELNSMEGEAQLSVLLGSLSDIWTGSIPTQENTPGLTRFLGSLPLNNQRASIIKTLIELLGSNSPSSPDAMARLVDLFFRYAKESGGDEESEDNPLYAASRYNSPDMIETFENSTSFTAIEWAKNRLYKSKIKNHEVFVTFTDDFFTMLNMGNIDGVRSCQNTTSGEYNAGLTGNIVGGTNKMIAIYDSDSGDLLARKIVRIRRNADDPDQLIVFLEPYYGTATNEKIAGLWNSLIDQVAQTVVHEMNQENPHPHKEMVLYLEANSRQSVTIYDPPNSEDGFPTYSDTMHSGADYLSQGHPNGSDLLIDGMPTSPDSGISEGLIPITSPNEIQEAARLIMHWSSSADPLPKPFGAMLARAEARSKNELPQIIAVIDEHLRDAVRNERKKALVLHSLIKISPKIIWFFENVPQDQRASLLNLAAQEIASSPNAKEMIEKIGMSRDFFSSLSFETNRPSSVILDTQLLQPFLASAQKDATLAYLTELNRNTVLIIAEEKNASKKQAQVPQLSKLLRREIYSEGLFLYKLFQGRVSPEKLEFIGLLPQHLTSDLGINRAVRIDNAVLEKLEVDLETLKEMMQTTLHSRAIALLSEYDANNTKSPALFDAKAASQLLPLYQLLMETRFIQEAVSRAA